MKGEMKINEYVFINNFFNENYLHFYYFLAYYIEKFGKNL